MKKIVALFFILNFPFLCFANIHIGVDCRAIDGCWTESMRFDIEGGYRYEDVRISALLSYGKSLKDELSYIDGGIAVAVYPFDNLGFHAGCTLFRIGCLLGLAAPDEDILFTSEAFLGWTFSFPYFYFEPRLSFSDTLSVEESPLEILRESIVQYSRFRLSLLVGVVI